MLEGCVSWPEEYAARYRELGLWRGELLGDIARELATPDPERIALVEGAQRITYAQLDDRAQRLACALEELGLRTSDRVVVGLSNSVAFVELTLALFRLGALPVFALPAHRRFELEHLCRRTRARALVVPDRQRAYDFREMAAEIQRAVPELEHVLVAGEPGPFRALADLDATPRPLPAPRSDDVAFFLLSGGTTGMPKLIPRTHDDYAYQLRITADVVGANSSAAYLAALPVAHNAALGCPGLLGTLHAGGRVVLAQSPSPDEIFPLVEREQPTLTTLMPTFLRMWSETAAAFGADLSGLHVEVGGAPLDPEAARAAQVALGCTVTHWFGMAEGVLCCTRTADGIDAAARGQGTPISPHDELLVVDLDDRAVAAGQEGELLVRGPMTLRGYYDEEEYNRTAFTSDGFLRTGDLVVLSATGELAVTGRIKDVINRAGEKISTGEVEEHIRTHPAIQDAALVGVADAAVGERSHAFVVAEDRTLDLSELRRHLVARGLAAYKLPDRLETVGELPRTSLGKLDKKALRARLVAERTEVPVSG
jgi:2,3-dihydroxybenzoate-AMP ligase